MSLIAETEQELVNEEQEEFFPGYFFEDEVAREKSKFLKETLELMIHDSPLTSKMKEYEKQVVGKYIKSGALTAFKTHQELKVQHARQRVIGKMTALKEAMEQSKLDHEKLEKELTIEKVRILDKIIGKCISIFIKL